MAARVRGFCLMLLLILIWLAGCMTRPVAEPVTITGKVMDLATQAPIIGATVTVFAMDQTVVTSTTTSADGTFGIPGLPQGVYTLVASAQMQGYADNAASVRALIDLNVSFALPAVTLGSTYCSLCGRVTDFAGRPIAGALVQADGGQQTNGVFTSKITDAQGIFFLYAVPTKDTEDNNIVGVRLMAIKEGYRIATLQANLAPNETIVCPDLKLALKTETEPFYYDDFESTPDWTTTGFWHWQASDPTLVNTAVPAFVNLSPLDSSGGAIPMAYSGTCFFWYGRAATGNYIGTQIAGDAPLSGGMSVEANSGTLISPPIDLTGAWHPILSFMTWYEIEGQNPNSEGYDLMTVEVSADNGMNYTEIGTLNPYVDPAVADRHHLAYTSGGFNQPPNWIMITVNLDAYVNKTIRVRFTFDTVDSMYNGFRGWFIDNVVVEEGPKPNQGWYPILPSARRTHRQ